ncbi:putative receptor-like protein kinase At4g00960 [Sesamum indicum]|uniref:Receptor-like protein kinase At4g00960 n=1 Tax=Sesamum indicum TaxID=4182 RepID=A0A6I9STQ6_SESIN|nr:putative receptor-like protein kinase At4g00960 [Sesamum indicum]
MSKSKSFFKNLIKPFASNSRRDESEADLENIAAQEQRNFPFEVLVAATKNFHPSLMLGQGGFGPVFKGNLVDGREIAVKKLSQRSAQGKDEFKNEAKLLASVQHRNVVNLLGYCVHDAEKLLVYEYVVNESLDKILFRSDKRELLDWKQRHDIIVGTARGLRYLHEEAPRCIIHRDIKASNILLDDKWVPKIADFGLARLFPEDQTYVKTRISGTTGYLAPEYFMHGNLSKKADVFSFGVVVLELISGQKNSTFNRDPDSDNLLEWAYKLYKKGRSLEVMDPTLVASADRDQVATFVQIGLLCVQSEPQLRPDMDRVVVILSRKPSNLEEPNRPGYYGSRYGRHHGGTTSSVTTSSDLSSSRSSEFTNTRTATLTASTSGQATSNHEEPTRPRRYSRHRRATALSSTTDLSSTRSSKSTNTHTATSSASTSRQAPGDGK